MKRNIFVAIIISIMLLVCLACSLKTEDPDKGFFFDEETFTANWNAWKNKNIQNYSFTLAGELPIWNFSRAIPLHEYIVNIIVKNGVMDSFEYIGDIPYDETDRESIFEPEFTSISDMYQKISDSAKYQKEWWENYDGEGVISTKFEIKYNAQLNYIMFFEPVSEWESGWVVDTTAHAVIISNFTILDE